ncbi:MAG: hypothetical protein COY57_00770 [Flavobacteriales bacterium CG_4_10_14_0_8_um_filter_32_5]|nr:MAG: hypothetical protein COY57_00770 [Flavobacteriales bacterium CG_4_10_14_0_8_um_filter_32_5]
MLKFIFSKSFLVNIAILIVLIVVVVFLIDKSLDSYTNHGESISVPSLEGLTEKEVEAILSEKELRYEILDSIFVDKKPKGVVIDQNPLAESLVKKDRKIYITVTKIAAPKILLPDVIDMSQRLAVAKLESYGLKVKVEYKPSEHQGIAIGYELKGKSISPNEKIDLGAFITLIIGTGKGDGKVMVPYLINLNKEGANQLLQTSLLSLGLEIYDETCVTSTDSTVAKVYKQTPGYGANSVLNIGSSVDIYLTKDSTKINTQNLSLDSLAM